MNELLTDTLELINNEVAQGFAAVWTRPDAAAIVDQFLEGSLVFQVSRQGIVIAVAE